jgi:hypothetical protein
VPRTLWRESLARIFGANLWGSSGWTRALASAAIANTDFELEAPLNYRQFPLLGISTAQDSALNRLRVLSKRLNGLNEWLQLSWKEISAGVRLFGFHFTNFGNKISKSIFTLLGYSECEIKTSTSISLLA